MAEGVGRFVELVIATTVGSIVGAFIAHGIDLSIDTFVRALFASCALTIFFFLLWNLSKSIGQARPRTERFKKIEKQDYSAGQKKLTYEDYEEESVEKNDSSENAEDEEYYEEEYSGEEYIEEGTQEGENESDDLKSFRVKIRSRGK